MANEHSTEESSTKDASVVTTSWITSLVDFSTQWISLVLSLAVLLVAVVVHRVAAVNMAIDKPANKPTEILRYSTYASLGRKPELSPAPIYQLAGTQSGMLLNATILNAYKNDGVICIRGLLSDTLLGRLDTDTSAILQERLAKSGVPKKHSQFHTVEHSAMFRNISKHVKEVQDVPALLQAALFSNISRVAAELLGFFDKPKTPNGSNDTKLRVIRDIFLAKDNEAYTCGWHVDDVREKLVSCQELITLCSIRWDFGLPHPIHQV